MLTVVGGESKTENQETRIQSLAVWEVSGFTYSKMFIRVYT